MIAGNISAHWSLQQSSLCDMYFLRLPFCVRCVYIYIYCCFRPFKLVVSIRLLYLMDYAHTAAHTVCTLCVNCSRFLVTLAVLTEACSSVLIPYSLRDNSSAVMIVCKIRGKIYGGPLRSCCRFIFHSTCARQPYLRSHVDLHTCK